MLHFALIYLSNTTGTNVWLTSNLAVNEISFWWKKPFFSRAVQKAKNGLLRKKIWSFGHKKNTFFLNRYSIDQHENTPYTWFDIFKYLTHTKDILNSIRS